MMILFIVLNIFLFVWWRNNQRPTLKVTDANATIISEIRNQKIKVSKFSTSVVYASYLAGKRSTNLMSTVEKLSNYNANIDNRTLFVSLNKASQSAKQSSNFSGKSNSSNINEETKIAHHVGYRYNSVLSKANMKNRSTYSQYIDGLPVVAKYGLMIFNTDKDERVTSFTQTKISDISVLRDERATITEEEAIVALYKFNELGGGDQLSKGTLSYDTSLNVNGYDIYTPVWVFVVTHKDSSRVLLKVNAFTGDNLSE